MLQVLPVNETGGDNSPYNAISSVALDPALLYLTPDTVPGLDADDYTRLTNPALLTELRTGAVNYPRVKKLKAEILKVAFTKFKQSNLEKSSDLAKELKTFETENARWLKPFVLFRALMDEHGRQRLLDTMGRESYKATQKAQALPSKPESSRQPAVLVIRAMDRPPAMVRCTSLRRPKKACN